MLPLDDSLRATLLGKKFHKKKLLSVDQKLSASSHANSILNSVISFVPAKRPYEDESKTLKSKYIRLCAKAVTNGMNGVNGKLSSCSSKPSTSKLEDFFEFHTLSKKEKTVTPAATTDHGIPPPMFEIFPAQDVRVSWDTKLKRSTAVGLHNLGNTCFLNSVLQILTNTAPFANYLMNNEHDIRKCPSSTGFCALCLMKNHIQRIFSCANGSAISPNNVVGRVRCFMKSHSVGRQEDAHEFLRYFIDSMQTAALHAFKGKKLDLFTKETSVIGRLFGGYHKNEVICNKCNYNSTTYDPFLDLSVEVKQSQSLEAALSQFTRPETLAHDNAYKCPRCKIRVSARKIFTIHQASNVLTIQLKRFDHNGKIDRFIAYPEKLSLRPYMTEKQGPPVNYKLYGVIVHQGRSTRSGHYYAYARNPCDQWHVLDDSRASSISPNQALKSSGAYLLFYIRTPTPVIAVKPQLQSVSEKKASITAIRPERNAITPQPPRPTLIQTRLPFTPVPRSAVNGESKSTEKEKTNGSRRSQSPFKKAANGHSPVKNSSELESSMKKTMNGQSPGKKLSESESPAKQIEGKSPKKKPSERQLSPTASKKVNGVKSSTSEDSEPSADTKFGKIEESPSPRKKDSQRLLSPSKVQRLDSGKRDTINGHSLSKGLWLRRIRGLGRLLKRYREDKKIDKHLYKELRKQVKNKVFNHKRALMEQIFQMKSEKKRKKTAARRLVIEDQVDQDDGKSEQETNVVRELEKHHGFGYGYAVKSWTGSSNLVDQVQDEIDTEAVNGEEDEWNQEFDRGKVKKRKRKQGQYMLMGVNPFQSVQNSKNRRDHFKTTLV